MEKKETQNQNIEVICDVICDSCGKSCKVYESIVDNEVRPDFGQKFYVFESMKLIVDWGYHSNKDTERWTADICEKCVDEKFSFVKFHKTNYI